MKDQLLKDVLTPRFIAAAVILLVCAASLQAFITMTQRILIKQPIELRRDLAMLPSIIGPYEVTKKDPALSSDMEAALGTTQYISWWFRDTRVPEGQPGSVIRLHVPYYTGTIDTVPHVPDRCFVAGGATPTGTDVLNIHVASDRITRREDGQVNAVTMSGNLVTMPSDRIPITRVKFTTAGNQAQTYGVTYFFVANNAYTARPEGVRLMAFNLFDRYAYYSKVEVMPIGVEDMDEVVRLTEEFLSHVLPEIFLCLPDWEAANAAPQTASAVTSN